MLRQTAARSSVEFGDENGIFIENVFLLDGQSAANTNIAIRTVDLDPPLVIPTKGYVVFDMRVNVGSDGRVVMPPTDIVDVAVGKNATMWVDNSVRTKHRQR